MVLQITNDKQCWQSIRKNICRSNSNIEIFKYNKQCSIEGEYVNFVELMVKLLHLHHIKNSTSMYSLFVIYVVYSIYRLSIIFHKR